jgi:non-specific serine/threonine protein kinase
MLAQRQGNDETGRRLLDESLQLAREAGDAIGQSLALGLIAVTDEDAGHYEHAARLWREALAVYREAAELERRPLEALMIAHLGVCAWGQGDDDRATGYWEDALALHRTLSDEWGIANSLSYLALAACVRGDLAQAATLQREGLSVFWAAGSVEDTATSLANTAAISAARGELETAARLFGAAEALRETIGSRPRLPEAAAYERAQDAVRAGLPDAVLTAAWTAGRTSSPAEAVAEAMAALNGAKRGQATGPQLAGAGLTPRELDVLRLLVAGRSDKEIGEALFISRRTAMTHVSHLLTKLGVTTRGAAAVLAVRERLV